MPKLERRYAIIGTAAFAFIALFAVLVPGRESPPQAAIAAEPAVDPAYIAAAGRIEPRSEEIKLGAGIPGRLAEVRVDEGQQVSQGQVIAVIENGNLKEQVASAQANVQAKEAELALAVNGARPEERREAAAAVREAVASLSLAEKGLARKKELAQRGYVTREQLDAAEREHVAAQSRLTAARQRMEILQTGTRKEDLARARSNLALAQAQLREAQAIYDKSFITAPIAGTILAKYRNAGESLPENVEAPVVSLGDLSRLRVRAEVDERDVADLRPGQACYVTAPAYGAKRFAGKVLRVSQKLGRKKVFTEEPTERVDTKVLETLIELDPGAALISGMRVDVFIQRKPGQSAS